jgi:hypothetical protein
VSRVNVAFNDESPTGAGHPNSVTPLAARLLYGKIDNGKLVAETATATFCGVLHVKTRILF